MVNRKYGFHSGVCHARALEVEGDFTINGNLNFGGISAGAIAVTGGIDLSSTVTAIGIDMGGTYNTVAINIDGTQATGIIIGDCTTAGISLSGTFTAGGVMLTGSYTNIGFWKGGKLYIHNYAYGNVSQTYLNYISISIIMNI